MYSDLTVNNPSLLKRFSHSRRFKLALELMAIQCKDKVLDYGTGDGFMVVKLLSANPQLVVGYEPMESQYRQLQEAISRISNGRVTITDDLNRLEHGFDKVCCLEVLEHLTEDNQRNALSSIKRVLNDKGFAVISVPIEVGLPGLLKNLARCILRQPHPHTTAVNILRSFFGLRIDRGNQPFIPSHIGFDYRNLEELFRSVGFEIKSKHFSPLKVFGGFVNSQVLYILAKSESNPGCTMDSACPRAG